jgi:ketosteroid isomerase-like protein
MTDTTAIDRWLAGYLTAWDTDAPEDVAALFAEDARYYTAPFREPHEGREDIVRFWIANGDSQLPWTFECDVLARQGDLYVVRGVTRYPEGLQRPGQEDVYHNLWLVTLDGEGRATEFVEYWMLDDTEELA